MKSLVATQKAFFIFGLILAAASLSQGAIILTIEEDGSDVVASYSGTFDTTDMGFEDVFADPATYFDPSEPDFRARVRESPTSTGSIELRASATFFGGTPWITAPTAFGTGGQLEATGFSLSSSDSFWFNLNTVGVSRSFQSGDPISGSLTFGGESFQSMGITPGTYTAEFGSGDTLTINAIPEPNSYGFLLGAAGLATAFFFRRRRSNAS